MEYTFRHAVVNFHFFPVYSALQLLWNTWQKEKEGGKHRIGQRDCQPNIQHGLAVLGLLAVRAHGSYQ